MNETTDASAILAPLWRFKWLILAVGILVAAGTYAYYNGKTVSYQAATQGNVDNGAERQGVCPAEPTKRRARKAAAAASPAAATANLIGSPVIHQSVVAR